MTKGSSCRGGAPVGYVHDRGPIEAGAVLYLRLWCSGPDHQAQIWNDFAEMFGPGDGLGVYDWFETLCTMCLQHGQQPLLRHHVNCRCLGMDESCFANFVGYASESAREDALLLAVNLVRPDVAAALVGLAETFGLALRMPETATRTNATIH